MALRDIDPQLKTVVGWGLAILVTVVGAQYRMYSVQISQFERMYDEQRAQLAQIRVDQVSINARQDQVIEKVADKLEAATSSLKEVTATVRMIDERGTRYGNMERDELRRSMKGK